MKLITRLSSQFDQLRRSESGQDLVEYALLVGLLGVAAGLFVPDLSESMEAIYLRVAEKLTQAAA